MFKVHLDLCVLLPKGLDVSYPKFHVLFFLVGHVLLRVNMDELIHLQRKSSSVLPLKIPFNFLHINISYIAEDGPKIELKNIFVS